MDATNLPNYGNHRQKYRIQSFTEKAKKKGRKIKVLKGLSVLRRGHSHLLFKEIGKVVGIGIIEIESDFFDRFVGIFKLGNSQG
jgi:hypothetical protein